MFYRTAGISQYTRRLVRALASLHPRFSALHILLDRRDTDTAWVPANVKVIRTITPAHHRFEQVTLPIELLRYSSLKSQVSIFHSPDFITTRGRFKKVITIHDLHFMEHPEVMSADAARYYNRIGWSAQQADRIIAVSNFTRDDIARLLPNVAHKVSVVHEAAEELRLENAELRKPDANTSLLLSQFSILNSQFLLFVGTLEPRKNLATLLRALGRLPGEVRLVIAGADGWGETDVGALANELNLRERVTLLGRVTDAELATLYRSARAVVMPSMSEGFGLPVLEAMARGTPVICSQSGALPEIAGPAALMQSPLDDEQLARNILAIWNDDGLHAELSRQGYAHAQMFSWDRAAAETLAVYHATFDNLNSEL
jgi:glycosyltransferase involved in cell wall biosynthesis